MKITHKLPVQKLLIDEKSQSRVARLVQKVYSNLIIHPLHPWRAGKHVKTYQMLNNDVKELQQQKTRLGSTPISQEQESEITNINTSFSF